MARQPNSSTQSPIAEPFELGLRFLRARRAQNLSWMRATEQALRSLADLQRAAGANGESLARLWTAQAGLVRDTAKVYGLATAHLAR
ncbi:MAG: hypothetical protein QOH72_2495 [Solirubrobacteraceae bacterium]|nr:hypothetical protein [Solirubrobacteraceae bacterium]